MSTPEAPRPGAWLRPAPTTAPAADPATDPATDPAPDPGTGPAAVDDLAARLDRLPVGEHADVLAAEHDRLHRLLATVDQL